MGEFIHMGFARKVIRRRRQRSIRSLAQWSVRGMKRDALVRDFIRRTHRGRTGVVIVELPEDESAIGLCSTTYVDYARRTEIGPGKFLFARPDQFHRFSRSFRQPRRFDSRFAGVLASISRA